MAPEARPLCTIRRGLLAGDGLPLPLLDRQRGRPPHLPRARPAGLDLPQHHARGLLPRLPSAPGRPLLPRAARAGRLRPAHGAGPRRQRVQPPRAGGGGLRAHGRAADRARPGFVPAARLAGHAPALRRRPHEHPLRRAASSRTRRSTTSSACSPSTSGSSTATAGCSSSATTAATRSTTTGCQELVRRAGARWRVVFTGQVDDDELRAVLRLRRPLPLPLRARGLLRAPAGGHGLRRAGGRLRRRRRAGHDGRAGLLVQEKDFPAIAELLHRAIHDPALRAAVVAGTARPAPGVRRRDDRRHPPRAPRDLAGAEAVR